MTERGDQRSMMNPDEARVLEELRRWHANAVPWVTLPVLAGILDARPSTLRSILLRLRAAGLAEHEHRVNLRDGAWKAADVRVVACRGCDEVFELWRTDMHVHALAEPTRIECPECGYLELVSRAKWPPG